MLGLPNQKSPLFEHSQSAQREEALLLTQIEDVVPVVPGEQSSVIVYIDTMDQNVLNV